MQDESRERAVYWPFSLRAEMSGVLLLLRQLMPCSIGCLLAYVWMKYKGRDNLVVEEAAEDREPMVDGKARTVGSQERPRTGDLTYTSPCQLCTLLLHDRNALLSLKFRAYLCECRRMRLEVRRRMMQCAMLRCKARHVN